MKKKVARKPVKRPAKKPAKKKLVAKKRPVLKKKSLAKKKPLARKKPFARKKPLVKRKPVLALEGTLVGEITHYFPQVNAAVVKLQIPLAVGDTIKVKGHTTDFTEQITSLQIDRVPVQTAKVGDEIGLQVKSRVRRGDIVTRL